MGRFFSDTWHFFCQGTGSIVEIDKNLIVKALEREQINAPTENWVIYKIIAYNLHCLVFFVLGMKGIRRAPPRDPASILDKSLCSTQPSDRM